MKSIGSATHYQPAEAAQVLQHSEVFPDFVMHILRL